MENFDFEPDEKFAYYLDRQDKLSHYRDSFVIENPDLIYMDGNSLGRLPVRTKEIIEKMTGKEWGNELIRGWNKYWYHAPVRIGDKIGKLIGAESDQVLVSDSTSVNLFKLVMAALALKPEKKKIISDDLNFPSDLYILQGCINLLGKEHRLHLIHTGDGISIDTQSLIDEIDEETSLVTLSHVAFKSGFLYDISLITEKAHEKGALVLFDLSHSVGVIPIELDKWRVDFAVGCTYKYLNEAPVLLLFCL